ncbi:MAG: hypothetical protein ACREOZ_04935 [Gloeomargaritales cyanobacterium]
MAVDQNTTTPTMAADFVVDVQMPPLSSSSSLSSASPAAVEGGAPIINGIKIFSYTDLKKLKKEDLKKLCKERNLLSHKGSKLKIPELVKMLHHWGNKQLQLQLQYIKSCEREATAADALITRLRLSASFRIAQMHIVVCK